MPNPDIEDVLIPVASAVRRRKLYFNFVWPDPLPTKSSGGLAGGGSGTNRRQYFACTPGSFGSPPVVGNQGQVQKHLHYDRWGASVMFLTVGSVGSTVHVTAASAATLDRLGALTGGSPPGLLRANDVRAWFELGKSSGISSTQAEGYDFKVLFCDPQGTPIPYQLPGGGTDPQRLGLSPVFASEFCVRIQIPQIQQGPPEGFINGVLHVERQHSIEV